MIGDDDNSEFKTAPVIAYIFLFPSKVKKPVNDAQKREIQVFFLEQINELQDACGTIAMIHALGQNREKIGLKEGILSHFLDQSKNLSVHERGLALYNNSQLRALHCSAVADERSSTKQVNVGDTDNHFVCFTTAKSGDDVYIVEIDGRKPFPILHGKLEAGDTFSLVAGQVIRSTYMTDPNVQEFSTIALASLPDQ